MSGAFVFSSVHEKAYLVGVNLRGSRPLITINDSLAELKLLAKTTGMEVVGTTWQTLDQINPSTFVGTGKVEEIQQEVAVNGANVVVFDDELSPRHQRELEMRFGSNTKVLDRSSLILDVFAQHASSREGRLQVELAQYEYRLPRLTRQWTHLARQAGGGGSRSGNGGVGLRGPGETQLEVDRREIRRRITKLKHELEQVKRQRSQYRVQRHRAGISVAALVGYTNAGKSTLLKSLSGADVFIADQLFATLDPTTRRITLPSNRQILLTDTVGFIQKLPTTLIAAFRATLEEIIDADLLLYVVDASHPSAIEHIEVVEDTLAEIDVPPVPRILVWNKIDLAETNNVFHVSYEPKNFHATVAISAEKGIGLDKLLATIEDVLISQSRSTRLRIPYRHGEIVSMLFETTSVVSHMHTHDGVEMVVNLPPSLQQRLKEYILPG